MMPTKTWPFAPLKVLPDALGESYHGYMNGIEVKTVGSDGGLVLPGKPGCEGRLLGVVSDAAGIKAVVADRVSGKVISCLIDDIDSWSEIDDDA